MLAVQVNYQGVQETIRHNQVAEKQNARHLDQEDIRIDQTWQSLAETKRHNLATESISRADLAERTRHNVATESLGYANLAYNYQVLGETRRHNIVNEGVAWAGLNLDRQRLAENQRHNFATESLTADSNSIQRARQIVDAQQGWSSLANARRANEIRDKEWRTHQFEAETARKRQEQDKTFGTWHNINESLGVLNQFQKTSNEFIGNIFDNIGKGVSFAVGK